MSKERETVSVCIIAQNNEDIIRRCLDSCTWADEILMVDGGSTDATPDIARDEYGATVYTRPYDYPTHQHNYIVARAETDWVFALDSDEVISPELAGEIQSLLDGSAQYDLYRIPRKLIDHGRWIRCCGTWPDYCFRLFRTGKFIYRLERVHPSGYTKSEWGTLENSLIHYSFDDLSDHLRRMDRWTTGSALEYYERGKNPGWLYLFVRFGFTFWRELLLRGGIRGGVPGLMYSVVRATEVFTKYAKVWEMRDGTTALDLEAELGKKRRADRDIISDPKQPDLLRDLYPDAESREDDGR